MKTFDANHPIRVVLADDSALMRKRIKEILLALMQKTLLPI
jgi:chemotaxis response regulator CheB